MQKKLNDWGFPNVFLHVRDRKDFERMFRDNMRAAGALGDIGLAINGSIKCFERCAQGKDNYRVKVWFTNLQYEDGVTTAEVLKVAIVEAP